MSVFTPEMIHKAWPHRWSLQLRVANLAGGTPTDKKVAEGWLRSKAGITDERILQEAIAQTMVERGVDRDTALGIVNSDKHLNGFKRFPLVTGQDHLYIEGRQLKAAVKEAANVAVASKKLEGKGWGATRKSLLGFVAEHVFVLDHELLLTDPDGKPITEPSEIVQRFVHTWRGSGIQYEEVIHTAIVNATVVSDYDFTPDQWAMIWLTGQLQGLGASRSQGYGTYEVTRWEPAK